MSVIPCIRNKPRLICGFSKSRSSCAGYTDHRDIAGQIAVHCSSDHIVYNVPQTIGCGLLATAELVGEVFLIDSHQV